MEQHALGRFVEHNPVEDRLRSRHTRRNRYRVGLENGLTFGHRTGQQPNFSFSVESEQRITRHVTDARPIPVLPLSRAAGA